MNTIKALVVEDTTPLCKTMVKSLNQAQIKAVGVYCAKEALDIIHTDHDIQYIIIDIGLPDIDGIELMGIIKKSFPEKHCIIFTEQDSKDLTIRCLNSGALRYFEKGHFHFQEVIRFIIGHFYSSLFACSPNDNPPCFCLEKIERKTIEHALSYFDGNLTHTADALDISRSSLQRKIENFGIITDAQQTAVTDLF